MILYSDFRTKHKCEVKNAFKVYGIIKLVLIYLIYMALLYTLQWNINQEGEHNLFHDSLVYQNVGFGICMFSDTVQLLKRRPKGFCLL